MGFAFIRSVVGQDSVILIKKDRPAWMAGKWNGVGGKVEPFETPSEAMPREFREETGLKTSQFDWNLFATLTDAHAKIYCFAASIGYSEWQHRDRPYADETEKTDRFSLADSRLNEADFEGNAALYPTEHVGPQAVLHNLPWLISMAYWNRDRMLSYYEIIHHEP